ncbi:MAG: tryptophan synthase subunit alpha [Planctomycetes bacterium]|nr:tryptophan synthase subunit alpha [Planctomycetota bacterium]
MPNPIDTLFSKFRAVKRKAFIPFVPAGDPDLATTAQLVRALAKSGAALVEIGFPYSDPIADGAVIQASYTRALARGLRIDDIFRQIGPLAAELSIPLVAMASFSLVHHRGAERFIEQASNAGFSGAIVPDLPIDEAGELGRLAAARDFKLIHLVTPTTPPERAAQIARSSTGFLYVVSVTGITGERAQLPPEIIQQLDWLRGQASVPLCVGFGISKPEHVHMLRDHADGIIVGSALVRRLEQAGSKPEPRDIDAIADLGKELVDALNG